MGDVHNRREKLDATIQKLEQESSLSSENLELLGEFRQGLEAEDLSTSRTTRYLSSFMAIDHLIDFNLREASEKQLVELVADINDQGNYSKDLSPWTINEYRKAVKKLYKWLGEDEKISFISIGVPKHRQPRVSKEELPTLQTVRRLQENFQNPRDRAFVITLWESGGRISEVLNTKWKHLRTGNKVDRLKFVESKTQPRTVPIKTSTKFLENWRQVDQEDDSEDYIFTNISRGSGQASYRALQSRFKAARKHSNIPDIKKTNFHAFRKSRATFLAAHGFNVFQLMELFGWSKPDTALRYIRLAMSDVQSAFQEQLEDQERKLEQGSDDLGTLDSTQRNQLTDTVF